MKILFIITSLRAGGAERVLTTLANSFCTNHEVIIVKFDERTPFYKVNENVTLKTVSLNKSNNSIIKKFLHNFNVILSIRSIIKKYNPDIVIPFMDRTNIYSIIATRFLKNKIIISERTNYDALKIKIFRFLRNVTYPFSDGMVVLSNYDYTKYSFVKNKKIIFNPLFINNELVSYEKKEKIILSVGTIVPGKAFDVLLQSLSKVDKDLLSNWRVYIIGEGEEKENLKEMTERLNLTSIVSFLGAKKNIIDYYKQASMFVSTSRIEGFPNALSEALSLGCASVATNCITGPSELVHNEENGFLVNVDDVDMISEKLELLMLDKELREKFSRKSIEFSKKYKKEDIVREWEEYINEII